MYSKSLGTGDGRTRADWRSAAGFREPAAGLREPAAGLREPAYRQTVRVPPNYSGHAFRDGEERSPEQVMSGVSHRDHPPHREEPPTPRFDGLPQVSTLGQRGDQPVAREMPRAGQEESPFPYAASDGGCPCGAACLPALRTDDGEDCRDSRRDSRRDSPCEGTEARCGEGGALRTLMERFPFGHGFGFEELLLLGLMLLLLHEGDGEGDLGETLVLLGILLLCG